MRILILAQWCYPEPDLKTLTFARELRRQGHDVQILTGFPNYPGGHLYEGYRIKPYQHECLDEIPVHRVPLIPSHSRSKLGRIGNYLSFALAAAILGPLLISKIDVIYAYHPPASISFAAVLLKLFKRVPVVYDIQDLWPDTLAASGMLQNKCVLALVGAYCRLSYRLVDHIVVLSNGFKDRLLDDGVAPERVTVIHNWSPSIPDQPFHRQSYRESLGWHNKFVILFAGNMGHAQHLDTVLDAARQLRSGSNILFSLIGDGVVLDHLKRRAAEERIENVQFLPRVESAGVGRYLKSADVLLVHLRDDPLFRITIPSKIQAYLRAGRPILVGVPGEAAKLIEEANCGRAFKPEDASDLLKKASFLARLDEADREALGRGAADYYHRELAIEIGTKRFVELFEALAS
jgi:colanic acid biosynthesis glycosyl transferase WcaI